MRPLKLMMQAFGPYAGTEIIDFTELGNQTMFVISGKTGSGKTTIFDGISYAIYGKASGEDRNGPELRSQFANEDTMTEVSLEFSLRQKTYYIWRSPQQEKKKARGDGTTTIGAKAELYLYDEDGNKQLLAANVRDVDEKMKEIILIDSNQFRQILMIPQGEFRKLLTSDSKDKEVILQRLFHTEMYKRIEDKLKEESTELKRAVEDSVKERAEAILRIFAEYTEELKSYLEAGSTNDAIILPLLIEEISMMTGELDGIAKQIQAEQAKRDEIQRRLYEAQSLANQLKARDDLKLQKAKLEEMAELFSNKEMEVAAAKKAMMLNQQEELCHRLKRELDQAVSQSNETKHRLEELTEQLRIHEQQFEQEKAREQERAQATEAVHHLQHMKEDVESFAQSQAEVNELKKRCEQLEQQKIETEATQKAVEQQLDTLQSERELIEKNQVVYLENVRKLDQLNLTIEKAKKFSQQQSLLTQVETTLGNRRNVFKNIDARFEDAKVGLNKLEEKWLHSQASILASKLRDGEACPVCGSSHHPAPANATNEEAPNEAMLKAAKQQVSELEKERAKAQAALFESESKFISLQQIVTDLLEEMKLLEPGFAADQLSVFVQTISSNKQQLEQSQTQISAQLKKLERIKTELDQKKVEQEGLKVQDKKLASLITEAKMVYTEKRTVLEKMLERIPENLRSIEAFHRQLTAAIRCQEKLEQQLKQAQERLQMTKELFSSETARVDAAEKDVKVREEKLATERQAFVDKMTEQGFSTYHLYHGSKRTEAQIDQLEREVRSYYEELRSVTDRFLELEAVLKDVAAPDVEGLTQAVQTATEQVKQLNDQYTELLMKKRSNEEIRGKIESINLQVQELEARYNVVGHLADMARGQNTYRITFERYVLASFLDDILREANARLTKMTSGRYQLLRKKDRSKGNVQSGLELLVFDQYTGQERHVKTLSGGESFKAALSLALGLADIVQQYAGGVSLETMFIDEGFGTLDPESLDQAIETLIDIQSSGRLVGIISHVPELKERIDARLEVIATQTGSMTQFYLN